MRVIAMTVMVAGALAALSACGFKPMYAPTGGDATIGSVSIPEISGKSGHVFRTELSKLLGAERGSATSRRLQVALTESISSLGLRVDESATRADLILVADYVLFDSSGAELFRGAVRQVASYDIPSVPTLGGASQSSSAYGELAAQNDARERAAAMLAERMRTELALRLSQARTAAPAPVVAPATP
jgi:LPS-assembly lipoprotein